MGCDGGTIPRRDELVRVKKKPEAKDKQSELVYKWMYCAITQLWLQCPIVMCGLGRLYNKISLIEALLNKDTMPTSTKHIKSLKDVKTLNLTPNPVYKDDETKEGDTGVVVSPFICPVIGLEMSGKFRFVALWSCGCVFSERALKEVKTSVCHKCQKPFDEKDIVVLNGTDEDLVIMHQRMELRAINKKKERSKVKSEVGASTSSKDDGKSTESVTGKDGKSNKLVPIKRQLSLLDPAVEESKKMKSDYSVAKDPKVTDVYKSLFTSHKSEKEQDRAHWVTYNPFYN